MWRIFGMLMVVAVLVAACGRKGPVELSLEEAPEALKAAFASAKQAVRTNVEGVARLLVDGQYATALLQIQALAAHPDLTDQQRSVLGGAMIAVNGRLQELAAAVDEEPQPGEQAAEAAAALEHYARTK